MVDDDQGGSLGWKAKGDLDPKFEEIAFALEPSSTSNPKIAEVKTEFGYHIIMVGLCGMNVRCSAYNNSGRRAQVVMHVASTKQIEEFFSLSIPVQTDMLETGPRRPKGVTA
jgi:hypothetical protein